MSFGFGASLKKLWDWSDFVDKIQFVLIHRSSREMLRLACRQSEAVKYLYSKIVSYNLLKCLAKYFRSFNSQYEPVVFNCLFKYHLDVHTEWRTDLIVSSILRGFQILQSVRCASKLFDRNF